MKNFKTLILALLTILITLNSSFAAFISPGNFGKGYIAYSPTTEQIVQQYWNTFFFNKVASGTNTLNPFQMGGDTTSGLNSTLHNFSVDLAYQVLSRNSDPLVQVYYAGSWGNRSSGTTPFETFHVPTSFTLADASGGNTPNNPGIIVNTSTNTALLLNALTVPTSGGSVWGFINPGYGLGMTHGGSFTAGGEVTPNELNNGINHAIAIEANESKYYNYRNGVGFVSPALANDSDASTNYLGTNADLMTGTWLAIDPSVTAASIGVTSTAGKNILAALQTYGGYIVDSVGAGYDDLCLVGTPGADTIVYAMPGSGASYEMFKIYSKLQIVKPAATTVVTGAAAEYSVRLLNTSFTGKDMNVRRSSDNTTQDVPFTSSGDLDTSSLMTFCGTGDCFMRTWYDQSGNGYDATQTTNANQPRIVHSGVIENLNGRPAPNFSSLTGSDFHYLSLSGSGLSLAQNIAQLSMQLVLYTDLGVYYGITEISTGTGSGSNTSRFTYEPGDKGETSNNNNFHIHQKRLDADTDYQAFYAGGTADTYQVHSLSFNYTTGAISVLVNGTSIGSGTSTNNGGNTSNTASQIAFIGSNYAPTSDGGPTGAAFKSYIPEIVFFQGANSNESTIRSNQRTYYGF